MHIFNKIKILKMEDLREAKGEYSIVTAGINEK